MTPPPWTVRSNTTTASLIPTLFAGICGILLLLATKDRLAGDDNMTAGFWLGVLLTSLALAYIPFWKTYTLVVTPAAGLLQIKSTSWSGPKTKTIPLSHITGFNILRVGQHRSMTHTFFLTLATKDGETIYTGISALNNRSYIESLGERIMTNVKGGLS